MPIGSGYSGPSVADGRVYVTDRLAKPKQVERVHCFAWETGELIWSYTYDCEYRIEYVAGPRATVTVHNGLAYALGAMGHLHCFDAATGELKWKRDLNTEYNIAMPTWGIASAPIVEGSNLIIQIGGTPGACIVAFDRETGAERWKALDDKASYSAPILITQGNARVPGLSDSREYRRSQPEDGRRVLAPSFSAASHGDRNRISCLLSQRVVFH